MIRWDKQPEKKTKRSRYVAIVSACRLPFTLFALDIIFVGYSNILSPCDLIYG